ncbi:hypothetical protein [Actinoplanes derwentensis]|uniref:hypothetical protein n=1 Tax=Actinoplanes derwentensis TaxID=113562 RepID=UPI000B8471DC|nr:hypothetical protein [Actinoplanes derwentensis]
MLRIGDGTGFGQGVQDPGGSVAEPGTIVGELLRVTREQPVVAVGSCAGQDRPYQIAGFDRRRPGLG